MKKLRLDTKNKRPHFFTDPAVDAIMTALLETMSENQALKERILALEQLLAEKSLIEPGDVEKVKLSEGISHELAEEQQQFLHDAFRALNAPMQSRSQRQAEIDE
ncbi:MAG: hypothetical protein OXE78_02710 [Gammaproteobacteria bacterium]|nr:hypothetical protein [Gammaproteobacteria bacterium]